MSSFWQDLRFAFRALSKSPWFAALAVVTLALGIAVNTSIFSIINGFLLRPMPVPHPEQLAVLAVQQTGETTPQKFSYPDYLDLRDHSAAFSDIIAFRITLADLAVSVLRKLAFEWRSAPRPAIFLKWSCARASASWPSA